MKQDKASSTAYTVLQGLLFNTKNPDYQHLITPEIETVGRQILAASAEGKKRLRQLDSKAYQFIAPLMQSLLMPGITLHYALRKQFIEDATRRAIEQGVTQVVNLGAGFDTLAWRLHKTHQQVNFIEIDHQATNRQKEKALFNQTPNNLHLLAVDFSETDTYTALHSFEHFDAQRPTLFICEGVLMYLDLVDIQRLFSALKQLTGSGTRFIFSCVEPMDSPLNNTGSLLKLYLKLKNEPLNWMLTHDKLKTFVAEQGYTLQDMALTEDLRQRYLQNVKQGTLHQGEYLALASAD